MSLSDRDLVRLAGVHPLAVSKYTKVSDDMVAQGTPIFVVQGIRTSVQQAIDYAIGRKNGVIVGRVVTFADGSTHKGPHQAHSDGYGYAIDFAFVPSKGRPDPYDKTWPWEDAGTSGENHGLIWGGRFHGGHMGDLDHLELPTTPSLTA